MFPDTGPLRLSRVSAVINLHHSKLLPYSQREERGAREKSRVRLEGGKKLKKKRDGRSETGKNFRRWKNQKEEFGTVMEDDKGGTELNEWEREEGRSPDH